MLFTILVVMTLSTTSLSLYNYAYAQTNTTVTTKATHQGEAPHTEGESAHTEGKTITRDSLAVLLEGITIPGSGFLHLYDSTPYSIYSGHIAANLPCEENSTATVNILTGVAPNLSPVELENVPPLSTPGELCLYHADIQTGTAENATVTDIALQNPAEADVELPPGSTVVVGVNEITPLEGHTHEEIEAEVAITTPTIATTTTNSTT